MWVRPSRHKGCGGVARSMRAVRGRILDLSGLPVPEDSYRLLRHSARDVIRGY